MSGAVKKVIEKILMALGVLFILEALALTGGYIYLHYEHPKTEEQKSSLEQIHNLKNPVKPSGFSEDLPDVEPDIYDDRHLDNATSEEELEE